MRPLDAGAAIAARRAATLPTLVAAGNAAGGVGTYRTGGTGGGGVVHVLQVFLQVLRIRPDRRGSGWVQNCCTSESQGKLNPICKKNPESTSVHGGDGDGRGGGGGDGHGGGGGGQVPHVTGQSSEARDEQAWLPPIAST